MKLVRSALQERGHIVTSRWLESKDGDDATESADMDWADIRRSDVVAIFVDVPSTSGGLHTELGIALQAEKDIIAVGDTSNLSVFFSLPEVSHCAGLEDFLHLMTQMKEFAWN